MVHTDRALSSDVLMNFDGVLGRGMLRGKVYGVGSSAMADV